MVVLGPRDVGKSTFCRYLAGRLLAVGRRPALLDVDPGQKDVGPPATVTLGLAGPGAAWEPTLHALHFVGSTDPVRHGRVLVAGVARLAALAGDAALVVGTPGLVHGPGIALQRAIRAAARPTLVVAIGAAGDLASLLEGGAGVPVLALGSSPLARPKTLGARRAARCRRFAEYFAAADGMELPLDALRVERLPAREAPAERLPGEALARPEAAGLLCGVADSDGTDRGLAILGGAAADGRSLRVRTPVPAAVIALLRPGTLRLSADFRESRGELRPDAG